MTADIVNHYSRDGFAGSGAHLTRPNYVPIYSRIEGTYAPRRLDFFATAASKVDTTPSAMPEPLLAGDGVSISVSRRQAAMPFSTKNVTADEVHYVVSGEGRFKTDFGILDCRAGDFILIPRAVGYRVTSVPAKLDTIVVTTPGELTIDPSPPRGVLNIGRAVSMPEIIAAPPDRDGTYEMVFRHKGGTTSHFYDFDPLDIDTVAGSSPVKCFNISDVRSLSVSEGGMPPPRLINDSTDQTLVFHLGSRRSDRPPIHVNADYDELIIYASGPAPYGGMTEPGVMAWVPKGIPHHGAKEDTPEPYQAWLVETRAALELTEAGSAISQLMETGEYGINQP
jgi:homogentisate 1,2-dioxygenase